MINFQTIKWKNLLSTGNVFTELNLCSSPTTLIVGNNGAGKSTILDALSFCLYGKPFRKINKPQLINSINNKDMVVEVSFHTNGDDYVVVRGIKPNRFEVYKNDQLLNQDAAIKDYQEVLEKQILKFNHRSFCQIVVLGSATYIPFMQLVASQRREVIEDLLDIQIFSTMNTLLRDRVSINKDEQLNAKYKIGNLYSSITQQRKHIDALNNDIESQISDGTCHLLELQTEVAVHNGSEDVLIAEITELSQLTMSLDTLRNDLSRVQSVKEKLTDKIHKLSKEINFYHENDNCPTCKQGIDHDFKSSVTTARAKEVVEIQESVPRVEDHYKTLEDRLVKILDIQKTINDKNLEINSLRSSNKMLERQIEATKLNLAKLEANKNDKIDDSTLAKMLDEMSQLEDHAERLSLNGTVLAAGGVLLKDGGIKSKVIKQYIPIINKLINKYLTDMEFFVQFELDEQFNETIKSRFRDEFSYQSFSEGEKFRINLAILFTWRTIAKMRNSASCNLLIMDEVMDSSLDNNGTDEFMRIIEGLTKDTNLFVISHKGDVLADKFSAVAKFVKQGNFSVMETA